MVLAAVARPTGGVKKDPALLEFTKSLSAVARASRWRKALVSLQSAAIALLQVDAFACSAAITACDRKSIWVGALRLFWRIGTLSIEADTPCFSAALGAVARSNLWEQSSLIEEERRDRHLAASATSAANLIFSFRGRWKSALDLLADLPSRRVEADVFMGNAALATCEDAEDSALLLVSHLPALQIQADMVSFNSAVGCCARCSSWQLGEQLLATARTSQHLDEVSFNSLADAFDKAGEWRRASEVLHRMQSYHLQPDLFTGSSSSSAASRAQAWVSSLAMFRSTRSLGIETDMGNFNVAVSAFGRAHDWGSAMAALSCCPRPWH
ncbi:unnamed protein product [Symbiodinium sp. CCMP2456]|nr:unnamed protein product [Symbiodinium sp. CCMP2456]